MMRSSSTARNAKKLIPCVIFISLVIINNVLMNPDNSPDKSDEKILLDSNNDRISNIHAILRDAAGIVERSIPSSRDDWSCKWSPNSHSHCNHLLHNRLTPPTYKFDQISNGRFDSQRWLFFGDSTMKRLFGRSNLNKVLVHEPFRQSQNNCLGKVSCSQHEADRCELNANFGLPYGEAWIPPDPNMFEGPIKYGAENAYCTDCRGCQTHFLECRFSSNIDADDAKVSRSLSMCTRDDSKRRYGGFMTMEFARDKEIQTPEYQTTQENIAAYLSRKWNTPELLQDWGKPICVLGVGNHDMNVHGITTKAFVSNVKFMLTVMTPVCEHSIWLGNTSNSMKSRYRQTYQLMKLWDDAVKQLIESEPELLERSTFVDVMDASLTEPHADFIHMGEKWYKSLGDWFISLM